MVTVLVVDDEASIVEVVTYALEEAGFSTLSAQSGPAALELFRLHQPALVVLDVMLPGIDGLTVCREIRATSTAPIILLTARTDEMDRVAGLELGADDYVIKPFGVRELVARVRANLRRVDANGSVSTAQNRLPDSPNSTLQLGPLSIDQHRFEATWHDIAIVLTRIQFELLLHLASNPGRVFTRAQLLDQVWGQVYTGDVRSVDSMVKRLRSRLRDAGAPESLLVSVRDIGYRFDPTTAEVSPPQ